MFYRRSRSEKAEADSLLISGEKQDHYVQFTSPATAGKGERYSRLIYGD